MFLYLSSSRSFFFLYRYSFSVLSIIYVLIHIIVVGGIVVNILVVCISFRVELLSSCCCFSLIPFLESPSMPNIRQKHDKRHV